MRTRLPSRRMPGGHFRPLPLLVLSCLATTSPAGDPPATRPAADPRADARFAVFDYVIIDGQVQQRHGYIDGYGKLVIPKRFDYAQDFTDGLAKVYTGDGPAYIDAAGRVVFRVPKDLDPYPGFFSESLCPVNRGGKPDIDVVWGGKWGYLDRHGKLAIEPRFTSGGDAPVALFSEGRAAAQQDGKWGFIDPQGKWVVPATFKEVGYFSEGLAAVKDDDRWGFIDREGKTVIKCRFEEVSAFREGVAAAVRGETSGFIDRKGEWAVILSDGSAPLIGRIHSADGDFFEGLAAALLAPEGRVPDGEKCPICGQPLTGLSYGQICPDPGCGQKIRGHPAVGFIDHAGKRVIPARFRDARRFVDALAAVQVGEDEKARWGFIDRKGRWVIEPRFVEIHTGFHGGLALVDEPVPSKPDEESRRREYIDPTGRAVWAYPKQPDRPGAGE